MEHIIPGQVPRSVLKRTMYKQWTLRKAGTLVLVFCCIFLGLLQFVDSATTAITWAVVLSFATGLSMVVMSCLEIVVEDHKQGGPF
jgi:predicted RND superfamily exporter protein